MEEQPKYRGFRLPMALFQLVVEFRAHPTDRRLQSQIVHAVRTLNDTVYWELGHIERLERVLAVNGIKMLPECPQCHSNERIVEEREGRLRRFYCHCGAYWRFGLREP